MATRSKPSPFSVASERFATVLRAVPIEIAQSARRNPDHRPLWTRTSETHWHRFLSKTTQPAIFY